MKPHYLSEFFCFTQRNNEGKKSKELFDLYISLFVYCISLCILAENLLIYFRHFTSSEPYNLHSYEL